MKPPLAMQAIQRRHFTTAAAVFGACLAVIAAVTAPPVPQQPVVLAPAENPVELMNSFTPMVSDLDVVGLGSAEADPLDALWQQLTDTVMPVIGPIILFGSVLLGAYVLAPLDWLLTRIFGYRQHPKGR